MRAVAARAALAIAALLASAASAHAEQDDVSGSSSCGVRYHCTRGSFGSDEYLMLRAFAMMDLCQAASHRSDLAPDLWLCGGYALEAKVYNEIAKDDCAPQPAPCSSQRPISSAAVYAWSVGTWSGCSRACGGGSRTRTVECRQVSAGPKGVVRQGAVANALCPLDKPAAREPCSTGSCHFCSAPEPCRGRGACLHSDPASRLPPRCECEEGWGGKRCGIPLDEQDDPDTKCRGNAVDSRGECCFGPLRDALGTCCALGEDLDAKGLCCRDEDKDACGICGGKSIAVDNTGRCCPEGHDLDARGVCCQADLIDSCGVCNGGGKSCDLYIELGILSQTRIHLSSETPGDAPVKPGASQKQLRDECVTLIRLALGEAVDANQLQLQDVEPLEDATDASQAIVDQLTALDAETGYLMHPYFVKLFLPAKSLDHDGMSTLMIFNGLQALELSLNAERPGTGQGLQLMHSITVGPVLFGGACGNGQCEWGESMALGNRFIPNPSCPSDCPEWATPRKEDADDRGDLCSGRGRWIGVGESSGCACNVGYMGSRCQECWLTWERHAGLPGAPCIPTGIKMFVLPLGPAAEEAEQLEVDVPPGARERGRGSGQDPRGDSLAKATTFGMPQEDQLPPQSVDPTTRDDAMARTSEGHGMSTEAEVSLAIGSTFILLLAAVFITLGLKRMRSDELPPSTSSPAAADDDPARGSMAWRMARRQEKGGSSFWNLLKMRMPFGGDATNTRTVFDSPTGSRQDASAGTSSAAAPTEIPAVNTQPRGSFASFLYPRTPAAGFYPKTPHAGMPSSATSWSTHSGSEMFVGECNTPGSKEIGMTSVERCGKGDWTPRTVMKSRGGASSSGAQGPESDTEHSPEKGLNPTARKLGFGFGLLNKAQASPAGTPENSKARRQHSRFLDERAAEEAAEAAEAPQSSVPQFARPTKLPSTPKSASRTPRRPSGRIRKSNLGGSTSSLPAASREPFGLYPTPPRNPYATEAGGFSPANDNYESMGWPGSLRFTHGPLGSRSQAFRSDMSGSPAEVPDWDDSDISTDSTPEKSQYFQSPERAGFTQVEAEEGESHSARKRSRGAIVGRTPQAPPPSVFQGRSVRFAEDESPLGSPTRPGGLHSALSPDRELATPSGLAQYSDMSPPRTGFKTPARSRLQELSYDELSSMGSPSLGLATPSAKRGETFQMVLGTPGGLSTQQVVDLLLARGIRPDQVSITSQSPSKPMPAAHPMSDEDEDAEYCQRSNADPDDNWSTIIADNQDADGAKDLAEISSSLVCRFNEIE